MKILWPDQAETISTLSKDHLSDSGRIFIVKLFQTVQFFIQNSSSS